MISKVTALYTLGNESINDEYLKVDYPDTLALYIIRSKINVCVCCIGLRTSRHAKIMRRCGL